LAQRVQRLIDRRDQVCFDVCVETCQIFDNVKHMRWFRRAVADAKGWPEGRA
jgi:hypothetical protein